jgi:hypothetical protein
MRRFSLRSVHAVTLVGVVTAALVGAVGPSAPGAAAPAAATSASTPAAAVPAAGTYLPVGPTRILDTGAGTGAPKAAVGARKTLTVQVSGRGDVPASGVAAVVLNVTVAAPSAGGYLTAYPAGGTRPATSSLNFTSGRAVPNLVVVRLGTGGKVSLYNGSDGTVRLVADVSGYYASGSSTQPGAFTSLAPARILDTGAGTGAPKVAVKTHATLTFQVTGKGGVLTSGVSSVVLNVTAAGTTGTGYVTAYPAGTTRPTTSSLNFTASRTIANSVVVRVGTGGKVSLYNGSTGTVRLIADVSGYFRSGTASQPGAFTSLSPARVLDTGAGIGAPQAAVAGFDSVTFAVAGHGGVPSTGVSAVVLNVTVASEAAGGYITVGRTRTSSLNFQAAHSVANLVVARVRPDGQVSMRNSSSGTVRLVADVAGYYLTRPGALTWGSPTDLAGTGGGGPVSCPTATFCAAVSGGSQVVTYNGSAWSAPTTVDSNEDLIAITCVSASFCMTISEHDLSIFNGTSWSVASRFDSVGSLTSISCATTSVCVAVDGSSGASFTTVGNAYVYDGLSWQPWLALPGSGLVAVSCATATFCGAADDQGDFLTYDGDWSDAGDQVLGFNGPVALDCTASTFCAAINGDNGGVQTYDGSVWSSATAIPTSTNLTGLSCTSTTFCEALSNDISVATYNGTTWSAATTVMDAGTSFDEWISCATTTFCVVLSGDGYGSTGHGATWTAPQAVSASTGYPTDVSCATATSCLVVTDAGYGEKFNGTTWSAPVPLLNRRDLSAVSCPTATFCLAVNHEGDAVSFDGSTATVQPSDGLPDVGLVRLSCASAAFCVAVSGSSSATFTGSAWSPKVSTGSNGVAMLSCPAVGTCLGTLGHSAEHFDGSTWSAPAAVTADDTVYPVACSSTTFCVTTGNPDFDGLGDFPGGGEDFSTYNGATWSVLGSADSGGWVSALSCPSSSFCLGAEIDGTVVTYDGARWSDPVALTPSAEDVDARISCPVATLCVALEGAAVLVGTG